MLLGKESVLEAFDMNKKLHWKLYYDVSSATNAPIAYTPQEGEFSEVDSRQWLESWLQKLQAGNYRIEFKDQWNQSKGYNSVRFAISTNSTATAPSIAGLNQQPPMVGAYSDYVHKDDIKKEVRKELEHERLKNEVEELRQMVAESQGNSLSNSIAGLLNQYPHILPALAGKFLGGPQVGVAGFGSPQAVPAPLPKTDTPTSDDTPTELDNRMEAVIQAMIAQEGTAEAAVNLLEKLIAWIAQNPVMYNSLKPTILNTKINTDENE